MTLKVHVAAATFALLCIATFWLGTVVSELSGDARLITRVKTGVLYGMAVLIPAMATAGATGAALGKGWRVPQVARKAKRMKVIAANGILILLPSAVFLALRANSSQFDTTFFIVQTIELAAGALNFVLLTLNMRDGLQLRARRLARLP